MDPISLEFWKQAGSHGFDILILAIAVWYLHANNKQLVTQLTDAHDKQITDLKDRLNIHREDIDKCNADRTALWKEVLMLKNK